MGKVVVPGQGLPDGSEAPAPAPGGNIALQCGASSMAGCEEVASPAAAAAASAACCLPACCTCRACCPCCRMCSACSCFCWALRLPVVSCCTLSFLTAGKAAAAASSSTSSQQPSQRCTRSSVSAGSRSSVRIAFTCGGGGGDEHGQLTLLQTDQANMQQSWRENCCSQVLLAPQLQLTQIT
jgi:hypothetical protein